MTVGGHVDKSGTVTLGGTAQTAVQQNTGRMFLLVQNLHATEDLWVNATGAAAVIDGAGSLLLKPAGSATFESSGFVPTAAVSIIAATTGHKFTILEG